jgi:hypothetical protein
MRAYGGGGFVSVSVVRECEMRAISERKGKGERVGRDVIRMHMLFASCVTALLSSTIEVVGRGM